MVTVTGSRSLAVPANDGSASDGDAISFSVTVGAAVSTSKVMGPLLPASLPIALTAVATAVNVSLPPGSDAREELHLPPSPAPLTVAIGVPLASVPSNTSTVTVVASLTLPENDGSASFVGDGRVSSVTVGGSVSISSSAGWLLPVSFVTFETSVAIAVKTCLPDGRGRACPVTHLPPVAWAVAVEAITPSA